jgi:hypothetical protein
MRRDLIQSFPERSRGHREREDAEFEGCDGVGREGKEGGDVGVDDGGVVETCNAGGEGRGVGGFLKALTGDVENSRIWKRERGSASEEAEIGKIRYHSAPFEARRALRGGLLREREESRRGCGGWE